MRSAASVVFVLLVACVSATSAKTRRDTYLAAYMESHGPSSLSPGEVYGTPAVDYGAPVTVPTGYNYGPPASEPHAAPENPLDPVHAKIVLVFKVLLKILVFKLIVKFLAIICVFLFLPKLSELGLAKEAADDARHIKDKDEEEKLHMTQFVLNAISGSYADCRPGDSPFCRLRRAIEEVDSQHSVSRLFRVYMKEEQKLRLKGISTTKMNRR